MPAEAQETTRDSVIKTIKILVLLVDAICLLTNKPVVEILFKLAEVIFQVKTNIDHGATLRRNATPSRMFRPQLAAGRKDIPPLAVPY
jgi:hypothetical protein